MRRLRYWLSVAVGCSLTAAAFQLPFVNWRPVVPPIDSHPLVIRDDVKGSGRFSAPRSGRRRHRGVDLAAELDSPVRAIRSGAVIRVGTHRGLGRFVELEHRQKLRSLYAHLSEVHVTVGTRVRQGQRIGLIGKTGNAQHPSIVPHLHLEVLKDGEPLDPQAFGLQIERPPLSLARTGSSGGATERVPPNQEAVDARGGE